MKSSSFHLCNHAINSCSVLQSYLDQNMISGFTAMFSFMFTLSSLGSSQFCDLSISVLFSISRISHRHVQLYFTLDFVENCFSSRHILDSMKTCIPFPRREILLLCFSSTFPSTNAFNLGEEIYRVTPVSPELDRILRSSS